MALVCPSIVLVDVHPVTFEFVCVRVVVNRYVCAIVTVYHPSSESVQSAFFDELADLLDAVATPAEPVYLVGDLNIRLDRAAGRYSQRLCAQHLGVSPSARRAAQLSRYTPRADNAGRQGRRCWIVRPPSTTVVRLIRPPDASR